MDAQPFDVENSRVIMSLELGDIETALQGQGATGHASVLRDRASALLTPLAELDHLGIYQSDRRIQQSIYQAMLSDFPAVESLLNPDASSDAEDDGGSESANTAVGEDGQDGYYDDHRIDLRGNTQLNEYVERLMVDENNPMRECYACLEQLPHSATVEVGNCHHAWCRKCLVRKFKLAVKNEDHYPVRCCGQLTSIPLDNPQVATMLGEKLRTDLEAKMVEYETHDRTYCCMPACSTFIDPRTITGNSATCPSCQLSTCTACKAPYHGPTACIPSHDKAFDQWREDNEAATCYACHRAIIISHGCNHMRCHCGTEFCYACHKPWKTCRCEIWDEERLLARATDIAERQGRVEDIEMIVEELREGQECRHDNVTQVYTRGGRRCTDCDWSAHLFLWECADCGEFLCTKCRMLDRDSDDGGGGGGGENDEHNENDEDADEDEGDEDDE